MPGQDALHVADIASVGLRGRDVAAGPDEQMIEAEAVAVKAASQSGVIEVLGGDEAGGRGAAVERKGGEAGDSCVAAGVAGTSDMVVVPDLRHHVRVAVGGGS